jgi:phosphoribosylformylglycinamidine cyclo-ligase
MSAGIDGVPGNESGAYRQAGVDYSLLDAAKRLALNLALSTSGLMSARKGRVLDESRGSSAFVFEIGGQNLALVLEGLGTKSVIGRLVAEELGVNRFGALAYDTVAAIINDLCCVGAKPLVVNAYFATGTPEWLSGNPEWYEALINGWASACADTQCVWGGGESPSLPGLVSAADIELAGSAIGVIPDGVAPVLGGTLAVGDEIVLVASSGLHANGASLARMVASRLRDGYATRLPGGSTLGEALLEPSLMYSPLVETLLDRELPVTYMSHITGHGLQKLMRPSARHTYRVTKLLPVPEVLQFLVENAHMSQQEAYSTFNMGCGFAIYCGPGSGGAIVELAGEHGLDAIVAGEVEAGECRVVIESLDVEFGGDALRLAPNAAT